MAVVSAFLILYTLSICLISVIVLTYLIERTSNKEGCEQLYTLINPAGISLIPKRKMFINARVLLDICYRLPDAQALLNEFRWQFDDIAPELPIMHGYLEFWQQKIEGPLHSVRYALIPLQKPQYYH